PVCGFSVITTKACERINAKCDPSRKRQAIDLTQPNQPKRDPLKCLHLLSPTERNVPVIGCGGCGSKGETAVFECELHGECTPLASRTDSKVVACDSCGNYARGHDQH